MDGTIFAEGVEVTASSLQNEADAKTFHIQRRLIDTSRPGIVSGLRATLNVSNTTIDVSSGWGYTARGDLVELTSGDTVGLTDYSTGIINYICLAYRETSGGERAHETDGTSRATTRERSSDLLVFTANEFAALPTTSMSGSATALETDLDGADLATDDVSRLIVLATVEGNGYTGSTPNALSSNDITQQAVLSTLLTAALPGSPTVTGVNLKTIASTTPVGSGSLRLTVISSTSWTMTWQAPGDGSAGASQAISHLTTTQSFTLASSTTSKTLGIEVVSGLLPRSGGPYTDSITVALLYDDTGPRFSVSDELHRGKTGSYIPTEANPHGPGFADFLQQVATIPQLAHLGGGYLATAAAAALARLYIPISSDVGIDRTLIWESTTGSTTTGGTRIYQTNADVFEVTKNARWTGNLWVRDASLASALRWAISNDNITVDTRTAVGTWADNAWNRTPFQLEATTGTGGTAHIAGQTVLGEELLASAADLISERLRIDYDDTVSSRRTLMLSSAASSASDTTIRIYRAAQATASAILVGANTDSFEITKNAAWDQDASEWVADAAGDAFKVEAGPQGVIFAARVPAIVATTWTDEKTDDGWNNRVLTLDFGTMGVHAGGTVVGGDQHRDVGGGDFDNTEARFHSHTPVESGFERWLVQRTVADGTDGSDRFGFRHYIFAGSDPFLGSSGFCEEYAQGCHWNGTAWEADEPQDAGSVHLTRMGAIGGTQKYRMTPSPSYPSSWDDTEWTSSNKAFGRIVTSGGGAITSQIGMNFTASLVTVSGREAIRITFDYPMEDDDYVATATAHQTTSGAFDIAQEWGARATTHCNFIVDRWDGAVFLETTSSSSPAPVINFVVESNA